jgi:hypothetical protein
MDRGDGLGVGACREAREKAPRPPAYTAVTGVMGGHVIVAHGGSVGHVAVESLPVILPVVLITGFLVFLWRRSGS